MTQYPPQPYLPMIGLGSMFGAQAGAANSGTMWRQPAQMIGMTPQQFQPAPEMFSQLQRGPSWTDQGMMVQPGQPIGDPNAQKITPEQQQAYMQRLAPTSEDLPQKPNTLINHESLDGQNLGDIPQNLFSRMQASPQINDALSRLSPERIQRMQQVYSKFAGGAGAAEND